MFPKFTSRFSSLAALGIMVAVLGGCAESISGTAANPPLPTRQDVVPTRLENEVARTNAPDMSSSKVIAESQRIATRRTVRFASEH
jgi:hypothetical protein